MTHPLANLVTDMLAVSDRATAKAAHKAAAEFHTRMADAMEAGEELTDPLNDRADADYWRQQYDAALGGAIRTVAQMPVKWCAGFLEGGK